MAINEAVFENEKELESWVFDKIETFLPDSFIVKGFQIGTISGKNGVPDGFTFDFKNRQWGVVECELLKHGVWPHIAEQITRFVVALQNPVTIRKIRNQVFEFILENNKVEAIVAILQTSSERLLQQLELFLESTPPDISIFIDDTNRDLQDMAQAWDVTTRVFRVKKLLVDGRAKYYSPDVNQPVIESEPRDQGPNVEYDIIEAIGGAEVVISKRHFVCYKLHDGSTVNIKKSKYHEKSNNFWYGVTPANFEYYDQYSVSHVVFVMGDFGFVKVPISELKDAMPYLHTSTNADGTVRHYHVIISNETDPELICPAEKPNVSLDNYYQAF